MMLDRAKELAKLHRKGHSAFQIRHAIVERSGGTPYGQYRQCLAEIESRIKYAEDDEAVMREIGEFVEIAEELSNRLGELTPERERELEIEMWRYKARKKLATDLLVYGRPSESTMDFILWLPEELRHSLLRVVSVTTHGENERERLIGWLYDGAPLLEA